MPTFQRLLVTLACVFSFSAFAPAAVAAPVGFVTPDRAGDARNPQLDLRGAAVTFDRTRGLLSGVITLGAPPTTAVVDSMDVDLGRFATGTGRCNPRHTVTISIPDAEDVAAGLPLPYAELFPAFSENAIGFLPTAAAGATVRFSSAESNQAVTGVLQRERFTCAEVSSSVAGTFATADEMGVQPLLAGRRPRCRIRTRTVRGGQSFPIRCRGAGRLVRVHIYKPKRGNADYLVGRERLRNGRFRVPTSRSMRGRYYITVWKGDVAIAAFPVRVR